MGDHIDNLIIKPRLWYCRWENLATHAQCGASLSRSNIATTDLCVTIAIGVTRAIMRLTNRQIDNANVNERYIVHRNEVKSKTCIILTNSNNNDPLSSNCDAPIHCIRLPCYCQTAYIKVYLQCTFFRAILVSCIEYCSANTPVTKKFLLLQLSSMIDHRTCD